MVALTPRISTPWLRTSRTPTSSAVRAALATSGVTELAWLTWVWMARLTPCARARVGDPAQALDDVGCSQCCGSAGQRLGGQPDVADVVDLQQPHQERLELLPRHVGHVAAGDHDVAYAGWALQVVDHRVVPVHRLERRA